METIFAHVNKWNGVGFHSATISNNNGYNNDDVQSDLKACMLTLHN